MARDGKMFNEDGKRAMEQAKISDLDVNKFGGARHPAYNAIRSYFKKAKSFPVPAEEYRDGLNLYNAYFVPNATDPTGYAMCDRRTKKVKPGYTPTTNGCTNVPDSLISVFSYVDFTPACNAHDICYGVCGTDRKSCDEGLHAAMDSACWAANLNWIAFAKCIYTADIYYAGVRAVRGPFYESAQDAACDWECVDCSKCSSTDRCKPRQ